MHSLERPLVVTSLNPYGDMEHQRACFRAWQQLGFHAVSVNVEQEAAKLFANDIDVSDIWKVSVDETGLRIHGKGAPRILPVLKAVLSRASAGNVLLVNSDIYPALRSTDIFGFWESCGSAVALTREECHSIDAHTFATSSPYRGGLDAFFMTPRALSEIVGRLDAMPIAERMAFGVPGWDYLMGAVILAAGGIVMDSSVLLHISHRQTYGNVDEFAHYVDDMVALNAVDVTDSVAAARQFSGTIHRECNRHSNRARLARKIFYKAAPAQVSKAGAEHVRRLAAILPDFICRYRRRGLESLAARLSSNAGLTLDAATSFLVNSPSLNVRISQLLFAILFCVACRNVRSGELYPRGNQHVPALHGAISAGAEGSADRVFAIANLFGAEIVNHRIFNRRLYNYLVLSTRNEQERYLLRLIMEIALQGKSDAA